MYGNALWRVAAWHHLPYSIHLYNHKEQRQIILFPPYMHPKLLQVDLQVIERHLSQPDKHSKFPSLSSCLCLKSTILYHILWWHETLEILCISRLLEIASAGIYRKFFTVSNASLELCGLNMLLIGNSKNHNICINCSDEYCTATTLYTIVNMEQDTSICFLLCTWLQTIHSRSKWCGQYILILGGINLLPWYI